MAISKYKWRPRLDPIFVGADVRIHFSVRNSYDDSWRDYTGATVSVTFTPERGSAFTNTGVLDGTPSAGPQCYVDIADTDTSGLNPDQDLSGVATITLTTGAVDRVGFIIPLMG